MSEYKLKVQGTLEVCCTIDKGLLKNFAAVQNALRGALATKNDRINSLINHVLSELSANIKEDIIRKDYLTECKAENISISMEADYPSDKIVTKIVLTNLKDSILWKEDEAFSSPAEKYTVNHKDLDAVCAAFRHCLWDCIECNSEVGYLINPYKSKVIELKAEVTSCEPTVATE